MIYFNDTERRVLMDALAEFIGARVGFTFDQDKLRLRACEYVEKRYAGQTAKWKERKAQDVLNRCDHAAKLLEDVRRGTIGRI